MTALPRQDYFPDEKVALVKNREAEKPLIGWQALSLLMARIKGFLESQVYKYAKGFNSPRIRGTLLIRTVVRPGPGLECVEASPPNWV